MFLLFLSIIREWVAHPSPQAVPPSLQVARLYLLPAVPPWVRPWPAPAARRPPLQVPARPMPHPPQLARLPQLLLLPMVRLP